MRFLETVQDHTIGIFNDEFGRIKLQYTEGSDQWYSVDPALLDNYNENDESTMPEGFRLHIQTAHFPNNQRPYIQTLLQRPLGQFLRTPIGALQQNWHDSRGMGRPLRHALLCAPTASPAGQTTSTTQ